MAQLFNKTFWKFTFGFLGLLILGFISLVVLGRISYNDTQEDSKAVIIER